MACELDFQPNAQSVIYIAVLAVTVTTRGMHGMGERMRTQSAAQASRGECRDSMESRKTTL